MTIHTLPLQSLFYSTSFREKANLAGISYHAACIKRNLAHKEKLKNLTALLACLFPLLVPW